MKKIEFKGKVHNVSEKEEKYWKNLLKSGKAKEVKEQKVKTETKEEKKVVETKAKK